VTTPNGLHRSRFRADRSLVSAEAHWKRKGSFTNSPLSLAEQMMLLEAYDAWTVLGGFRDIAFCWTMIREEKAYPYEAETRSRLAHPASFSLSLYQSADNVSSLHPSATPRVLYPIRRIFRLPHLSLISLCLKETTPDSGENNFHDLLDSRPCHATDAGGQ